METELVTVPYRIERNASARFLIGPERKPLSATVYCRFPTPTKTTLSRHVFPGMQHFVIYAAQPYGLPLDEITLPQYLKTQGYRTAGVGKV